MLILKGANKPRMSSCSLEHPWGAWPRPRKSSVAVARGRVPWWRAHRASLCLSLDAVLQNLADLGVQLTC